MFAQHQLLLDHKQRLPELLHPCVNELRCIAYVVDNRAYLVMVLEGCD